MAASADAAALGDQLRTQSRPSSAVAEDLQDSAYGRPSGSRDSCESIEPDESDVLRHLLAAPRRRGSTGYAKSPLYKVFPLCSLLVRPWIGRPGPCFARSATRFEHGAWVKAPCQRFARCRQRASSLCSCIQHSVRPRSRASGPLGAEHASV